MGKYLLQFMDMLHHLMAPEVRGGGGEREGGGERGRGGKIKRERGQQRMGGKGEIEN